MESDRINYLPYVLKFDGKDNHIVFPEMNIDYSQGFTIEAWVYYNSFQSWSRIIDFCNRPGNKDKIVFANFAATNTLALDIKRGEIEQRITANNALETGKWMHLTATVDASGNGKLYKNGQEIQTGTIHLPESVNRTQNYIGKSHGGDGYFDGRMSEVRLWNRVRTAEEIQKDLHRRLTGKEAGLVGYWPLNEGTGNTVSKSGTINGATWHQEIFFPAKEQFSYMQPVLSFHGLGDYVEIKDPFDNNKEFTICLWVKPASINDGESHGIIGKTGDLYLKPGLSITPDKSALYFDSYDASGKRYDGRLDNFFEAKDQWVHITWVKQGLEYKIYRNGQLLATKPAPESFYTNKDTSYWIGRGEDLFSGEIAEVSIWNKAINSAEIRANFSKQLAGNEAGLVGYWPFDDSSGETAKDKTSRANSGKIVAASWGKETSIKANIPSNEPTFIKSALKFDGTDDYLEVAYHQSLNPSQFTVSAWVKIEGNQNSWRSVITCRNVLPNRGYMFYGGDNNKWQFWMGNGGGWSIISSTNNIELNTWTHLTGTYDGTNQKFYINGELVASNTSTFSVNTDKSLRIGAGTTEGNSAYFFAGQIAEISIWNRARNQDEIKADMYRQLVGNESGLMDYWPLDEGSGNIAKDKTTSSKQGTINGATWQQQIFLKTALKFDGVDDCVNLGKKPEFKVEKNLTLEAWVCVEQNKEWTGIISSVYDTGWIESGYGLLLNGNGGIYLGVTTSSSKRINYLRSEANSLPLNEWHHIAGTYDGQQMKIYIDGVEKAKQAISSPSISYDPENDLRIGMYKDNDETFAFKGKITEARIWNIARTQAEIQKDLNRRLVGNEAGLVGYWPLDEGSGNIAKDKTSRSNQGTIDGATWQQQTLFPSALAFDGIDDYIDISPETIPVGNEITISFWAKGGSRLPQQTAVIEALSDNNYRILCIHLPWSNSIVYFDCGSDISQPSDNFDRIYKAIQPAEYKDEWVHWAFVKNATTGEMKIYRNGALWHSENNKKTPLPKTKKVQIGRYARSASAYYNGVLAELCIWNKARNEAEIKADMNKSLIGNEAGLFAYWPLNEGTGNIANERANNSNQATINGAIWQQNTSLATIEQTLQLKSTLRFSQDFVEVKDPFENNKEFTICLWVKPSVINNGNWHGLLGKSRDKYLKPSLWLAPDKSGLACESYDTAGKQFRYVFDNFFPASNQWVHIAWVKRGTEYKLYRNGELLATKPAPESFYNNSETGYWLGRVDSFWPGEIAETSIWNHALSDVEIKGVMRDRLTGNELGLIDYWPLNEAAGKIVNDLALQKNNGTINGAIWKVQEFIKLSYLANDENFIRSPLRFDGQNDYIVLPETNIDYSQGFTIEAWVYYNSFQSWSRIIDFGNGPDKDNIIFANTSNGLALDIKTGASGQRIIAENSLEIGKWTHLAGTIDAAGNCRLYKHGKEIISGKLQLPSNVNRTVNYIARSNWTNDSYFDGRMAEVRLWNRPRSAEELQKNMQRRLGGNETGLVGYWPLNERTGDRILDKTSNGKHGTIKGAIWLQTYKSDYLQPIVKFAGTTGNAVKIPSQFNNNKEFTISLWVKPAILNDGSFRGIINMPWGPALFLAPDKNGLYYHFWQSKEQRSGTNLKEGVDGCLDNFFETENQWVHIAWLKRGKELYFYRNGELLASKPAPEDSTFGSTNACHIGFGSINYLKSGVTDGKFFPGEISNVSFWNRPCSQDEITASMHRRLVGNEVGLVGYWPLDEGAGIKVFDRSNNGRSGDANILIWEQQILFANELTQPSAQERKIAELTTKNQELENKIAEQDKKTAEQDKKIAAQEQKISQLESKTAEQDKKIAAQEQKNSEQDRKIAAQEQKNSEQDKKIGEQEQKNSEQDKLIAELVQKISELQTKVTQQEQKNLEQDKKDAEQDKKIAEQEQKNLDQDKKDAEHDQKIAEQEQKISSKNGQEFVQKLQPTDLKGESFFGEEAAISGEWAIAGARKADGSGIQDTGLAYIFQLQNQKWEQKQKLQPADLLVGDQFGCAVAIAGEWAIAGAMKADSPNIKNTGAAYIFQLENGIWQQKQKLQPAGLSASDRFGKGIAISGEWAIVGAYHSKAFGLESGGAAYVFRLENGVWQQKQKLQPIDLKPNQCFGHAIAISGEWAIVGGGDRYASASIKRIGAAYIYHLENGVWRLKQKLQSPQATVNDLFGYSVAICGEYALVGAVSTTVSNNFAAGTVYSYKLEQGVWQQKQKIHPEKPKFCGFFGATVSISGKMAVVGSTRADSLQVKDTGSACIFQLENGMWQLKRTIQPTDLHYESYFGFSTPIDGEWLFVTAAWAKTPNSKQVGAVYIFGSV